MTNTARGMIDAINKKYGLEDNKYERARNNFEKACDDYYNWLSQHASTDVINLIKKEKEEMKIQWRVKSINATTVSKYQSPSISAELEGYVVSGKFNPIELSDSLQKQLDGGNTAKESKNDQRIQYCKRDVDITKDYYMRASMTIKNVIFSNPATIVFWMDGTKTVVKCQEGDIYDPEKGLAMAIAKKALGNQGNYCNVFEKWLPEGHEAEFKKAIKESMRKERKTGSKKAK